MRYNSPTTISRLVAVPAILLVLSACHDSPRSNPLDPELTPAVALTAAADDTAGTVALSWAPYSGTAAFREYLVLRNVSRSTEVETLCVATSVSDTSYLDRQRRPDTAYEYRVAVVNQAGLSVESLPQTVPGYGISPVQLLAAQPEPLAGQIRLRWSRFRDPGFAAYRVYRRRPDRGQDSLLYTLADMIDTTAIDTSALHLVVYAYTVEVVTTGSDTLAGAPRSSILVLPAPALKAPVAAAAGASVALSWEPYRGPRFSRYEVRRRTALTAPVTVASIEDPATTTWTDSGLTGNVRYYYAVAVRTSRDEEIRTEEAGAAFHELVQTWEFPGSRFIRLARQPDGAIAALLVQSYIAGEYISRVWTVPLLGREAIPTTLAMGESGLFEICKRGQAIAGAPLSSGGSLVAVVYAATGAFELRQFNGEGALVPRQMPLAEVPFEPDNGAVDGLICLQNDGGPATWGHWRSAAVTASGESLAIRLPWSDPPAYEAETALADTTIQGWSLHQAMWVDTLGVGVGNGSALSLLLDNRWNSAEIKAEYQGRWDLPGPRAVGLQLGRGSGPWVRAWYNPTELRFECQERASDSSATPQTRSYPLPISMMPQLDYELGLSFGAGTARASLGGPLVMGRVDPGSWTLAMAQLAGETTALAVQQQAFLVDAQGQLTALGDLGSAVTEVRVWQRRGRQMIGLAQPNSRCIRLGSVPAGSETNWPSALTQAVGPVISSTQGVLSYPISFDVGPDGRVFVLDVGLSRVLVFDSSRRYLTQFGERGDGEGAFDFGQGAIHPSGGLDLAGSLAVDAEGYIYVADELNCRVQKFAP